MIGSIASNVLSELLIAIAINAVIFNIIYSTINCGVRYLKNVLIYTICMEIRQMIVTGIASLGMFLTTFGIYFIVGLILIWILERIAEYFPRISFITTSIVLQAIIGWLLGFLI